MRSMAVANLLRKPAAQGDQARTGTVVQVTGLMAYHPRRFTVLYKTMTSQGAGNPDLCKSIAPIRTDRGMLSNQPHLSPAWPRATDIEQPQIEGFLQGGGPALTSLTSPSANVGAAVTSYRRRKTVSSGSWKGRVHWTRRVNDGLWAALLRSRLPTASCLPACCWSSQITRPWTPLSPPPTRPGATRSADSRFSECGSRSLSLVAVPGGQCPT
jgi:hypothetical protein